MCAPPKLPAFCLLLPLLLAGCGRHEPAARASAPSPSQTATTSRDWPTFRGDVALTGVARGQLSVPLRLLWSFKTGGPVNSSAVVADGRVFVGSGDGHVYALDLKSGTRLWAFQTEGPVEAAPLALNGRVFIGSHDGRLYALDATTGALVWKYATGEKILGAANWFMTPATNTLSPSGGEGRVRGQSDEEPFTNRSAERSAEFIPQRLPLTDGSGINSAQTNLLIGSYDYFLHCVDAATGRSNWVYETGNYVNGTPAIADGVAVVGGCDAILHVVNLQSGTKVRDIEAGAYVAASVALADGHAYYGHYESQFQSVRLADGTNVWTFRDRNFPYLSSAAITTNRVLFGGRDKRLHCLDRESGKPIWQFATRGKVDSSPVVCGDKVVVGSDDGRLYVVALADGAELWSYEIGQPVGGSPAVVAGKIIIGSEDGSVYCFGEK